MEVEHVVLKLQSYEELKNKTIEAEKLAKQAHEETANVKKVLSLLKVELEKTGIAFEIDNDKGNLSVRFINKIHGLGRI